MSRRHILTTVCALCLALPVAALAQRGPTQAVRTGAIAEKLGLKLAPGAPVELDLGNSATTMLANPEKLVPFGIKGMHEGARVTITCVGPDRIRVEADEMEPVAQRSTVTLKVTPDGSLAPAPERPQPPAPKPPLVR